MVGFSSQRVEDKAVEKLKVRNLLLSAKTSFESAAFLNWYADEKMKAGNLFF